MDKTLVKGVNLLQYLVEAQGPCTVSGLAKALDLQASNVHRTLQTWCALGFVAQSAHTGEYHCTLRLFEWGSKVAGSFDVRRLAHEYLIQLAQSSQETIHLSVLEGADIVYLDKIDSPQPVRAYSEVGGRAPAHCVATGKALLAAQGEAVLASLPKPLPKSTPNTIKSLSDLREELALIRETGYAVNREEWRVGVSGLGAVIRDQSGMAIAAVGLSAPASRMGDERIRQLGRSLMETANQISRALGGRSR
jgi:IclR family KDG regulon transcriptional repressor